MSELRRRLLFEEKINLIGIWEVHSSLFFVKGYEYFRGGATSFNCWLADIYDTTVNPTNTYKSINSFGFTCSQNIYTFSIKMGAYNWQVSYVYDNLNPDQVLKIRFNSNPSDEYIQQTWELFKYSGQKV